MVIIVVFAAAGLGMAIAGFRSRSVPCDPACATCGYDLRGYAKLTRCSECGGDLTATGAVRTSSARASRKQILTGLVLIALPWCFLAIAGFLDSLGPHWERLRSNDSLIARIDSNDNFGPWLWNELARRLTSGKLKNPQATAAVGQYISLLKHQGTDGGDFGWSLPFYTAADRAGAITPAQYLQIAQMYYKKVRINLPFGVQVNSRSQLNIDPGFMEFPGQHRVITFKELSMSGAAATTEDILHRPGQGNMLPPNINLLMPNLYTASAAHVPEGEYQLKFVVLITILPAPGTARMSATVSATPPPPIPAPLAQWTETTTMPVQVSNSYGSASASPPPLRLRTDPAADPQATGALSIVSAEALCYTDATIVIFRMKVAHVPIWCCFNPKITIADAEFSTGPQPLWPALPIFEKAISCESGPLPKDIATADLDLVPDIEFAKKTGTAQIWGKTISFKRVPLRRRNCGFSLKKRQSDQLDRIRKSAAAELPTTLPSPSTAPAR